MTTWTTVPLGDVADLQAGAGFPLSMQGRLEGELPLAKVGDISRAVRAGGYGLLAPLHHITKAEAIEIRARIFPAGSTVFAKIGEAISQNYRLFTDREAAFDNNVMGVIPRTGRIDPRYLFRFLQTLDLYAYASKTTVPALRKSDLERIPVPLPGGAEQRRIADMLDKADAIRRKRKEVIALTEELLRSAFLEMFGDPVANPKCWEVKPLGESAEVNRGKFSPRPRNDPKYYGGESPFIQTGDLRNSIGYLRHWKQTLNEEGCAVSRGFARGTVAIAIAANIGDTAIVDFDFYCPDSVVGIVPRAVTAEYLEMALRFFQPKLTAEAPETAQKNINLETLRPLKIPAPPFASQAQFGAIYRASYATAARMSRCLHDSEQLFSSLVHRAFRGELSGANGVEAAPLRGFESGAR